MELNEKKITETHEASSVSGNPQVEDYCPVAVAQVVLLNSPEKSRQHPIAETLFSATDALPPASGRHV